MTRWGKHSESRLNEREERISFSFGENWRSFLGTLDAASVERAGADIDGWLGEGRVRGQRVVDIGSGSGLHSLAFHLKGAAEVVSLDSDPESVHATRTLWERAGRPPTWSVSKGSILDDEFVASLGAFDIVYAWGVLHHTGDMWKAVANTCNLGRTGGVYWIAIYRKGHRYQKDVAVKRRYNAASPLVKKLMVYRHALRVMAYRLVSRRNPLAWNEPTARGMNVYHDIVDWLGGLPYEVASLDEVVSFCRDRGLKPIRVQEAREGGCSIFTFRAPDC